MNSTIERLVKWSTVVYARLLGLTLGLPAVAHYARGLRYPGPVLRAFGACIGEGTIVYPGIVIHGAKNDFSSLVIGQNCRIGRDSFFDLTERITIGDTANIGMRAVLITHVDVAFSPLSETELPRRSAPINIGPGAVIFAGATILHGVTVGECAVVAASSLVSTNVAPWTLVLGNPARVLRRLNSGSLVAACSD